MLRWIPVVVAVLLVIAPFECEGQGKGKGKGHQQASADGFSAADRELIARGLPPGLAKRNGDLPPGLEKQLRRKGTLPPGLEKKLVPLPAEVETRLPPCPPDVRRGLIGGVAVMFNTRTGLIVDAFAAIGR